MILSPTEKGSKFTMRRAKERTIGQGVVAELYEPEFLDTWWKFDFKEFMKGTKPMKDEQVDERKEPK